MPEDALLGAPRLCLETPGLALFGLFSVFGRMGLRCQTAGKRQVLHKSGAEKVSDTTETSTSQQNFTMIPHRDFRPKIWKEFECVVILKHL